MSWQHAWPQDAIAIGINLVRLKSWACLFLISIPRFSVTLCGNISVKLHRDLPCIGPVSFQNQHLSKNHTWWDAEAWQPGSYIWGTNEAMATLQNVPAPTSHTSTSQGWALYTKALAVRHGPNPGRRNNLTTLNLLLPCCKRTSLTGCFCLRLLGQEDHVLISICCTSTIHLHARPQGKHSTHYANRSDPCRKAPAFSVWSDGAYTGLTLSDGAGHDLFVR